MVVHIGKEGRLEEHKLIAGGNEGVFQAGTFDSLEAKANDIHNATCSKCFFGLLLLSVTV